MVGKPSGRWPCRFYPGCALPLMLTDSLSSAMPQPTSRRPHQAGEAKIRLDPIIGKLRFRHEIEVTVNTRDGRRRPVSVIKRRISTNPHLCGKDPATRRRTTKCLFLVLLLPRHEERVRVGVRERVRVRAAGVPSISRTPSAASARCPRHEFDRNRCRWTSTHRRRSGHPRVPRANPPIAARPPAYEPPGRAG